MPGKLQILSGDASKDTLNAVFSVVLPTSGLNSVSFRSAATLANAVSGRRVGKKRRHIRSDAFCLAIGPGPTSDRLLCRSQAGIGRHDGNLCPVRRSELFQKCPNVNLDRGF